MGATQAYCTEEQYNQYTCKRSNERIVISMLWRSCKCVVWDLVRLVDELQMNTSRQSSKATAHAML